MADLEEMDERIEELETLQSIYPELILDSGQLPCAKLELKVAPSSPLSVSFGPSGEAQYLQHLPPLCLHIVLPARYPADTPPSIEIFTTPPWLPGSVIMHLRDSARSMWEEYGGSQILFAYISQLQEMAETAFGLSELVLPADMQPHMTAFSNRMHSELFQNATFDCGVCLEPKKGSACYRMQRCSHVFCVACLQDYYNNCIAEGDVNSVKCMSTECTSSKNNNRKERLVSPKELLQIPMEEAVVKRYAVIRRKKKIEADPSIIFCPRAWCQGAMRTEKYPKITSVHEMDDSDLGSEVESTVDLTSADTLTSDIFEKRPVGDSTMDRLAICEDCTLAFCRVCLASWHGDFLRCEPRDTQQLTEEDQASLNYILKNTSPCPTCAVPCQKSFGCNHMTCFQCKSHFCYLCSAWLSPDCPYEHFNNPRNKGCFRRLMDMAEGDMVQDGVQFGGRRGAEQVAEFWEQEAMRMQMELDAMDG